MHKLINYIEPYTDILDDIAVLLKTAASGDKRESAKRYFLENELPELTNELLSRLSKKKMTKLMGDLLSTHAERINEHLWDLLRGRISQEEFIGSYIRKVLNKKNERPF